MNIVFKMMLFSIGLNFSTGLMMNAFHDSEGNTVFNNPYNPASATYRGTLSYNETFGNAFITQTNETIDPGFGFSQQTDWFIRIWDKVNLGIVGRVIGAIKTYMFGFIGLIRGMFGGLLDPIVSQVLFSAMEIIIGIGYVIGAVWLWTGKNLTQ